MDLHRVRCLDCRSPSIAAVVLIGVLATVGSLCPLWAAPVENASATGELWGPEANGIRCRLVAVPANADDESPDSRKTADTYARADDVTFVAELKNVGTESATLLGVRYGESYGSASGKLATSWLAPHLFEFEFTDEDGKLVPRPKRVYLYPLVELSGTSAHQLTPGQSLIVLLRPSKFASPMDYQLSSGTYRAKIHYRGPANDIMEGIKEHWPDKPHANAWSGEVISNQVAFTVASDADALNHAKLEWGEANRGLQAAVEFRPLDGELNDPPDLVPLGTRLDVIVHLQNVSDQPIALVSESWRQGDELKARDEAGNEAILGGPWYTGVSSMVRWTLEPDEVADIRCSAMGVVANAGEAKAWSTQLVGGS